MSVLRKVAREIPRDFPDLHPFLNDMFETMYASDGVGLAAPQVGKSLRVFVVDGRPMAENYPDQPELEGFKKVFINPIILETSGRKWGFEEGCLSLPQIHEEVQRPETVKIEYFNENWELLEESYDGIPGRIIQHEYDHLEGKLFVDHVSPLRKKLLAARLNAISKGRVDAGYKIVYPKK